MPHPTDDQILAARGEEFSLNRADLTAFALFVRDRINVTELRSMLDVTGWDADDMSALVYEARLARRARVVHK